MEIPNVPDEPMSEAPIECQECGSTNITGQTTGRILVLHCVDCDHEWQEDIFT